MSSSDATTPQSSKATQGKPPRVAIIGGGISGLVALREVTQRCPRAEVVLYEASERVGGVLQTSRVDSWLIEHSADMMATHPSEGWQLCEELGLVDEMLPTNQKNRGALVYRAGRLYPVPEGFSLMASASILAILKSRLLSWSGKWRLARERWVPARQDISDESFESFALRRCGREAYEYLIQPLVSGIYTADPTQLSMQATSLTRFVSMEKEFGSLTRGMLRGKAGQEGDRTATGARYGMFVAPREGMQQLVDRLVAAGGSERIQCCRPVTALRAAVEVGGWQLDVGGQSQTFDRVILATAAAPAARLLAHVDDQLSSRIAAIEHASCAVVVLAFPQPSRNPGVFGLVVPNAERRPMIAASFGSNKFPGRCPAGGLLVRVFFGGALNEAITEREDDELIELAKHELREVAHVSGEVAFSRVVRWKRTMPQYHVGHLQTVAAIEERLQRLPTLALAGNAYRGVGIPDCVRGGRAAAEKICAAP